MKIDVIIHNLNVRCRNNFYRRSQQKRTGKSGTELYTIDTWGDTRKGDWYGPQFLFNSSFHIVTGFLVMVFQISNVLGIAALFSYREYTQPQGTWYKKVWDVICFCIPWLIVIGLICGLA